MNYAYNTLGHPKQRIDAVESSVRDATNLVAALSNENMRLHQNIMDLEQRLFRLEQQNLNVIDIVGRIAKQVEEAVLGEKNYADYQVIVERIEMSQKRN